MEPDLRRHLEIESGKNSSLEMFRRIRRNKIVYWEFFGKKWQGFGEECQPLRHLHLEIEESLGTFLLTNQILFFLHTYS